MNNHNQKTMNVRHLILLLLAGLASFGQENHPNYLNQLPPTTKPAIFAPNLISKSNEYEFGSVFNKAVTEFYYGVSVKGKGEIRYTQLEGDSWTTPKTLFLHEQYGYNDPFLSPDENRLYFISTQPLNGKGDPKDYDIWYAERQGNGWSQPINAGPNINTEWDEYYNSFTDAGTLYFSSNKNDNNFDIYSSSFKAGEFQKTQRLGDAINTPNYEADVFIAPDASYIIFCATRPDGLGQGDLYISFKKEDGSWTSSKNMGKAINTKGHELCPYVSHDGRYFLYTSNQDIYWVSTKIFESYR